jgi:crotonobetainyl-CoA:carnitine CoA-transferase CaiB-like acyl-CoA transferase
VDRFERRIENLRISVAGERPQPMGNENMTASPSGAFRTGQGLLNIAANQQQQFETLCRLIGREALASDPRFADREERKRRRHELRGEIEQALAARSAQEWSAILNTNGVPAGEVLDVPSALEHPQIAGRGLIRTFEDVPQVDRAVPVVRAGFRLASGDPAPAAPPPALGADTDALLAELGYSATEIEQLRREQAI